MPGPSQAQAGIGSKIEIESVPGNGVYAQFGEVVSIGGPETEVGAINVTHLQSPDFTKEFIPGLIDGGLVNLEINFTRATMSTLQGLLRAIRNYKITFADSATTCTFAGMITKYGNNEQVEEAIRIPLTIKVSGRPAWA